MPEPPSHQHLLEQRRAVAHDPVDPDVEQPLHLRGVVDRPDVHGQVAAVCGLEEAGIGDADARLMLTTAFCRVVADRLEDRELAESISALIERAMPSGPST